MHLALVNCLGSLPRNSVVKLTDRLDMTIVVDWDIKPQIKQTKSFQITNQMITACKSYITHGRTETVWTQPSAEVIKKLSDCIRLNEEYQRCFHKTKEKLEKMPNERPFEFSEMYIFGKFDTFTKRLKHIISIFDTFTVYSTLAESKIEGMFYQFCRNLIKKKGREGSLERER